MLMLHDYRVRQRDLLLDISRALTEKLDLSEVLRRILEASASMLAGEIGLLVLRDEPEQLRIQAAFGVSAEQLWVFQPMLNDFQNLGFDVERLNLRTRQIAKRLDLPLKQVIALPMSMSEEPLGLILVFRTFSGVTTLDDRQILQSFADQAAIAVHNARLYAAVIGEKQRLSTILENSADGIMILDHERCIQRFNKALGRMTGWRPEMAIGRQDGDVIRWKTRKPGHDLEDLYNADENADQSIYMEGDLERLDGLMISVGITYALIRQSDGQPASVIANVRDITHFRKAEELKDTFISVISHELKTPVALIKGYAGTLLREDAKWEPAAYRNALTVIEEEADRLTELIDNLLSASKLKAQGMRLNMSEVNLQRIANQSAERFQTQTDKHQIKLKFPPDMPLGWGDEVRLRQVIDNLLSNAIKYAPNGGKIELIGSYDHDWLQFAIKDQGLGLDADQLGHVFERFYRVDDALSRTTQGAGLGLYLARAVIEAHGGRIWAESQPNQGATFFFTIPRFQ